MCFQLPIQKASGPKSFNWVRYYLLLKSYTLLQRELFLTVFHTITISKAFHWSLPIQFYAVFGFYTAPSAFNGRSSCDLPTSWKWFKMKKTDAHQFNILHHRLIDPNFKMLKTSFFFLSKNPEVTQLEKNPGRTRETCSLIKYRTIVFSRKGVSK